MASLGKPMAGPHANTDTLGTGEALNYKHKPSFAFSDFNVSLFNNQMKDFGQQIISEIIFSLILESEDDSFAVRVCMKVGQMILTLKEIVLKKGDIFHQDKK